MTGQRWSTTGSTIAGPPVNGGQRRSTTTRPPVNGGRAPLTTVGPPPDHRRNSVPVGSPEATWLLTWIIKHGRDSNA
ncbi:hypothetical protein Tco_0342103 [Tanacetum coccineum]